MRSLGLTTPQYAALSVLEREEELSGAELARRCFVTPQTMNGILVGLESAGFVERRAHPTHGRVMQARLTDEGAGLLGRAHDRVTTVEERMVSGLSEKERQELLSALRRCTAALGSAEASRSNLTRREPHFGTPYVSLLRFSGYATRLPEPSC